MTCSTAQHCARLHARTGAPDAGQAWRSGAEPQHGAAALAERQAGGVSSVPAQPAMPAARAAVPCSHCDTVLPQLTYTSRAPAEITAAWLCGQFPTAALKLKQFVTSQRTAAGLSCLLETHLPLHPAEFVPTLSLHSRQLQWMLEVKNLENLLHSSRPLSLGSIFLSHVPRRKAFSMSLAKLSIILMNSK